MKTRPLGLAVIFAALCTTASAQITHIEIEPGLYDFKTLVTAAGQTLDDKAYEYCLTPEDTRKSVEELIGELVEDGECEVSNIELTSSTGSAYISCQIEDTGMTFATDLDATYGRDYYTAKAEGQIENFGIPIKAVTSARRRGECPAGWTPPEGISAD